MIYKNKKLLKNILLLMGLWCVSVLYASDIALNHVETHKKVPITRVPTPGMYSGNFLPHNKYVYVTKDPEDATDSHLNDCFQASLHGYEEAMYDMGYIYEQADQRNLALKWYMLSFQKLWFKDADKAHGSLAKEGLLRLLPEHINVLLIYPRDILGYEEKIYRIIAIIEFYKNGSAEPYLTQKENDLKIHWLAEEKRLIIKNDAIDYYKKSNPSTTCQRFHIDKNFIDEEEKHFLSSFDSSYIFENFQLGLGYYKGEIDECQPDYLKSATYFVKAGSVVSFFNMAVLYREGRLGNKPDYTTAKAWFKLSGTNRAWCEIGFLYNSGFIGKAANRHKQTKKYLKKARTPLSYLALSGIYSGVYEGSKYKGQPNVYKARQYLEEAVKIETIDPFDKDHLKVCEVLGDMYVGLDRYAEDNSFYKLAIKYLKKAVKFGDNDIKKLAYSSLNILYMRYQNYDQVLKNCREFHCFDYYYLMGFLYEKGLSEKQFKEKKINYKQAFNKDAINYQKAFDYYLEANDWYALMEAVRIWRLNLKANKENFIGILTEKIRLMSSCLQGYDKLYFEAMVKYYLDDWERSIVLLKEAYALQPSKQVHFIIESIETILAKELMKQLESPLDKGKDCSTLESIIPKPPMSGNILADAKVSEILMLKKVSATRMNHMRAQQAKTNFIKLQSEQKKTEPITHVNIWQMGFQKWFNTIKDQGVLAEIHNGLSKLETGQRHAKFIRPIESRLFELRVNGCRIYFTRTKHHENILFLGGDKNSQDRDIKKAKDMLKKFKTCERT